MATGLSNGLPHVLQHVQTKPLFLMHLDVRPLQIVGAAPGAYRRIGVVPSGTGSRSNVTPLSRSELDCGAKRFRKGRSKGLPLHKHSKQADHARPRTATDPGCSGSTHTASGPGQPVHGVPTTASGAGYTKSHGEEIPMQGTR